MDCIGIYISSLRTQSAGVYLISPVAYGPWGGSGGSDFQDGMYTGVRQIVLSRGAGIAGIKVEYDRNGQSIWGNRHGGTTNAIRTDTVSIHINNDKGWLRTSELQLYFNSLQ